MLILDALRKLKDSRLYIPQFHLGHLGFVPELQVYWRNEGVLSQEYGREITVTPFKGGTGDLFVFKCVFKDEPGVVRNALKAFTALRLKVVSLESATIHANKKHVLFCILSWDNSLLNHRIPLDQGTRQKFVDFLPLLPTEDWRYLVLLETLVLFCGDTLTYKTLNGAVHVPNIQFRLSDALEEANADWSQIALERSGAAKTSKVYLDLERMLGTVKPPIPVIMLSETETKSLRLIFPPPQRCERLLHVAFVHSDQPGAQLAIAMLVRHHGFNIVTSLLRKHNDQENVWEMMLEYVGVRPQKVIESLCGKEPINWFMRWCASPRNTKGENSREVLGHALFYDVRICRPYYPRVANDEDDSYQPLPLASAVNSAFSKSLLRKEVAVGRDEIDAYFATRKARMKSRADIEPGWRDANSLVRDLERYLAHRRYRGSVFVSLQTTDVAQSRTIKERFRRELQLDVTVYIEGNSKKTRSESLAKIRDADFFLGVWHPDKTRKREISPWLPFEYGAADALGKQPQLMVHKRLAPGIAGRVDPEIAWIGYDTLTFDRVLGQVMDACRNAWLERGYPRVSVAETAAEMKMPHRSRSAIRLQEPRMAGMAGRSRSDV